MSAFLIFFGRGGSSDIEQQLDKVKLAIGAVVLGRAADAGFSRLYAVTNDDEAAAAFRAKGAAILPARTEPFHFGQELSRIVHEKKLDRVCTIGSAPCERISNRARQSSSRTTRTRPTSSRSRRRRRSTRSICRRRTTRCRAGCISRPDFHRGSSPSRRRRSSTSTRRRTRRFSRGIPSARRSSALSRRGRTFSPTGSRRSCAS